jgi:hypothetical protein
MLFTLLNIFSSFFFSQRAEIEQQKANEEVLMLIEKQKVCITVRGIG